MNKNKTNYYIGTVPFQMVCMYVEAENDANLSKRFTWKSFDNKAEAAELLQTLLSAGYSIEK